MDKKQFPLFDHRFLESFAGTSIVKDTKIAVIELIANAWDAGATRVIIKWPEKEGDKFSILDNGHGMSESEFDKRFRTLAYNRSAEQGKYVEIPESHKDKIAERPAFGKNGIGRLGGFAFGDYFYVKTWRNGFKNIYKVTKDVKNILTFQKTEDSSTNMGHGTEIYIPHSLKPSLTSFEIRKEIGMRFLTDPHFEVILNNKQITFADIPDDNLMSEELYVEDVGKVKVTVIDVQTTDKTTQQHGMAWHVNKRLVGECTWKGSSNEHLIDGRRVAAKRYIFIIEADCLKDSLMPDWTSFKPNDENYLKVLEVVEEYVKNHILALSKEQRIETFKSIEKLNKNELREIGLISREKWEKFIIEAQVECPSLSEQELEKLSVLLLKLEKTESKYNIIDILSRIESDDLENLNELLTKWEIDFAKIVLDEIEYRSNLLEQLKQKVDNKNADEVQDLQPLFERSLWIFGPEYETISYTSNQGMTNVIQNLFNSTLTGSLNRPDFVILEDGTVGLYSYPRYDESGNEIGTEKLTVVELKRIGVKIGENEKSQAWKYVKELYKKGILKSYTKITCFVLGKELESVESEPRTEKDGKVNIIPMDYDTVIKRAESRLLNLHSKIRNAPFLNETRTREYLKEKDQIEMNLI